MDSKMVKQWAHRVRKSDTRYPKRLSGRAVFFFLFQSRKQNVGNAYNGYNSVDGPTPR